MHRIDKIISDIIKKEGGFVNHPNDHGKATKWGVTQATLTDWLGREATIEDVKNLSQDDAFEIFYRLYYQAPHIDTLPEAIQPIITDMAVNHGPKKAIKLLQEVLLANGENLLVDGVCGKATDLAAHRIYGHIGTDLINQLVSRRLAFYEGIVKNDAKQRVFLAGWRNRANSFLT
jgi:lysozyme family protein